MFYIVYTDKFNYKQNRKCGKVSCNCDDEKNKFSKDRRLREYWHSISFSIAT